MITEDWLEVKMETEESPEPDRCAVQSPPPLLPDGSRSNIILTPPAGFADFSLQGQHPGTPHQQIHSSPHQQIIHSTPHQQIIHSTPHQQIIHSTPHQQIIHSTPHQQIIHSTPHQQIRSTPAILQQCGGTYTIPGRLPLMESGQSPHGSPSSLQQAGRGAGHSRHPCPPTSSQSASCPVRAESGADDTLTMTSLLQRGTPSIMATSSMIHSPFAPRSPSSAPTSSHRTPVITATDSVMGNSTFAVRSPCVQQAGADMRTPSLLVTDSLMGNSTFAVQQSSAAELLRSNLTQRTPSIWATDSVVGNSTMKTPVTPLPAALGSTVKGDPSRQEKPETVRPEPLATPSTLPLPPQPPVRVQSATTSGTSVWNAKDGDREAERCEQTMDMTPSPNSINITLDELADCWARMDSFKHHEDELKEELEKIKGQFFLLLNTLGLSHDIYYNAVTPAETPTSQQLDSYTFGRSLLTAAEALALQQQQQQQGNSQNFPHTPNSNSQCSKTKRMSTPHSTPRKRNQGRGQQGVDRSSKYADLVIEQLLAKARSDSSSSKSNSPPDVPDVGQHSVAAAGGGVADPRHPQPGHGAYLSTNVNVNRGSGDLDTKTSAGYKVMPVFSQSDVTDEGDMSFGDPGSAVPLDPQGLVVPSATPEGLLSTSSGSAPLSSNGSSGGSSVPDLGKELVSRMQYYSDFTIDRQKKIDEAIATRGRVAETSDEASPPAPPSTESSSDKISPRCVEGSESVDHFKLPLPVSRAAAASELSKTVKSHRSRHNPPSSGMNESDTSSGTGSLPRSQHSSRPSSRSSKHSSRDRQSGWSSSGDHRSSSRGSRCSTHPLASSTFIADPSNSGSSRSGSVYTWSLDNSSDENLHQSFLRSEKRRQRQPRSARRQSKSSRSKNVTSHGATRPATVIGADSPPQETLPSAGNTLHLTGEFSVIGSPPRRFGGNRFENSMYCSSTPHFSSLPRTSTRIGGLLVNGEDGLTHKASSSPELSTPCSDLNCAHSKIGPSNVSSNPQQQSSSDASSTPFKNRPDVPGKSSSGDSGTSYHSQCLTCNPGLLTSPRNVSVNVTGNEDPYDEILTTSPNSYASSGLQPPCNSYMSPDGSNSDYTTVSNSSAEQSIVASAPRQPRAFAVRSPGVFKVPFSPAARTVRRKAGAGGHSTHNVGVRAAGTPHFPVGSLKHKETVSKRKLFATGQNSGYHAPKILDRKALVRKFKKFSSNFKKDKDNAQIHTLANL